MANDAQEFRLRYVGRRFHGARLPLDVLADLPAFRDLLVAFAKDAWRRQNPKRQRVPKGFEASIVFNLVNIEEGSAAPVMVWDREHAQESLPGISDSLESLVEESYQQVVSLFDEAAARKFPQSLSGEHIRALNRFGSGLGDQEKIEFPGTAGSDGNVVYLDTFRRKELITHVKESYEARIGGIGRLSKNDDTGYITVLEEQLGYILIPMDPQAVREIYDGNLGSAVQFDLLAELDHQDKLVAIKSVYGADLVDEQIVAEVERCINRISEFSRLGEGWHDGDGRQVGENPAALALNLLSKRPSLASICKVYPTLNGGILFEFESAGWDWSVEFAPEGGVEFYGVEIEGSDELEPQGFPELDQDFFAMFDAHVGR